ncbi:MAG: RNA polymerase sigma factor [Tenacibaculum sp.]
MDKEFSKSLKRGDLKAYNKLFNTYYPKLYNYTLKLTNNTSVAKDIVQETFIKLWLNKQHIKPHLSVVNYLVKICHNEFLMHVRKTNKDRALLDALKAEAAYEILCASNDEHSASDNIKKAIDKLSPKCREAFMLSKYDKMKYKDIAKKMGISVKTVENHISKAYNELRKNLSSL